MPAYPYGSPIDQEMEKLIDAIRRGELVPTQIDRSSQVGGPIEIRLVLHPRMAPPPSIPDIRVNTAQMTAAINQAAQSLAKLKFTLPSPREMNLHGVLVDGGVRDECLTGYRDFSISLGGQLQSRNGEVWQPYERLEATCRLGKNHDITPDLDCQCGIYAFNQPDNSQLRTSAEVWGEVYMWGQVFICSGGYRAEFAYPRVLFTRNRMHQKWFSDMYGVPVMLVTERCGMAIGDHIQQEIDKLLGGEGVTS